MSRDLVSSEWADTVLRPHRQQLEQLEGYLGYIRNAAYLEGLTAHLRSTEQMCPFCFEPQPELLEHLVACSEVPPHLREELPE